MMLKNLFYNANFLQDTDPDTFLAHISFIRDSFIFKAHFPGMPIVPGACLVQISKELIEDNIEKNTQITLLKNLKFLKPINPDEFPEVTIRFSTQKNKENYSASVSYTKDEHVFCKLDYFFITT